MAGCASCVVIELFGQQLSPLSNLTFQVIRRIMSQMHVLEIGVSLSEPHIDELNVHNIIIMFGTSVTHAGRHI